MWTSDVLAIDNAASNGFSTDTQISSAVVGLAISASACSGAAAICTGTARRPADVHRLSRLTGRARIRARSRPSRAQVVARVVVVSGGSPASWRAASNDGASRSRGEM